MRGGALLDKKNFRPALCGQRGSILASFLLGVSALFAAIVAPLVSVLPHTEPAPVVHISPATTTINGVPISTVASTSTARTVLDTAIAQPAASALPQAAVLSPYITQSSLSTQLNELSNSLKQLIYANTGSAGQSQAGTVGQGQYSSGGYTNNIALSQIIDQLNGTVLNNVTVNGISGLTPADIPALNYLSSSGGTTTGALTVTGYTNLATTTVTGGLTVNGNTNITEGGQLTVGDKIIAPGEIGLGTSSPVAKLAVQSTNPNQTAFLIYGTSTQASPFVDIFSSANANLFRITASGNVGIGTTSPAQALSVQGGGYFSGDLTVGGNFSGGTVLFNTSSSTNFIALNATTTSATSTSIFSNAGHFASGVVDSLTSAASTITNLIATTITDTNLTSTNSTTTNATSTNSFVSNFTATNGVMTNASSTNATSTNLFSTIGHFASGIVDTLTGTLATITNFIATNSTTTNATTTNSFISSLVAGNATSTNSFATTASSTNLFTSALNAGGNALVVTSTGNVGVSTSSPFSKLSVTGTVGSAQFTLAYDQTRYAQLQVNAVGDLVLSASGGNVWLLDQNLYVCSGGACPAATIAISGTGNVEVKNRLIAGSLEETCPSGYVWVPGTSKYGTLPGFCTMKYDASNDGSGNAVSVPSGAPWVNISQTSAIAQCQAIGPGYHLMSEPEWMTIASEIAALPINDIDAAAGLQLATGHSDNNPGNALAAGTSATDPVVSGCNLMKPLSDASNAYVASSCEERGNGASGSTDADKGYYGTGNQWSASGYGAGGSNKSQLRTFVLPTGATIWDMAGNVWQWTDATIWSASGVGAASSTVSEMPDAGTWTASNWYQYTAITNYKSLGYARPDITTWSSTNGIGQIYLQADTSGQYRAFIRGGDWGSGAYGGVFTLLLSFAPGSSDTSLGFRCSR